MTAFAIALIAPAQGAAAGQPGNESPAPDSESLQEDLATEAWWYARDHNVSKEEALRRLEAMPAAEEVLAGLEEDYPMRYAGGWIDNGPDFQVIVRFTAGPEIDDRRLAEKADLPIRLTTIYADVPDFASVVEHVNLSLPRWAETFAWLEGVYVDVTTPSVVLMGQQGGADEIPQYLWVDEERILLTYEHEDAPSSDSHKGGLRLTNCTSGFTVINVETEAKRFLTAAHCPNAQEYFRWDPPESAGHSSNYVDHAYSKNSDIQWHRPDDHPVRPRFYGAVRAGDGILQDGEASASVGSYLCHQGKNTGYSCGDVDSTAFAPDYAGACPDMPCNASFVKVSGPNLDQGEGDSGGPWYRNGFAYGIHKGGQSDGSPAWFSKFNWLPSDLIIYRG